VGPETKNSKRKKKIRACSLTHNTWRVGGHVGVPGWD